ncbi:MAG: PQQ-binding-like beta-propeller repeat protein [Actinomycetota bacterium]
MRWRAATAMLAVALSACAGGDGGGETSPTPGTSPSISSAELPSAGRVAETIPVGNGPDGLALGGGDLWVANFQGHGVTRVDPETSQVVARIPTGASPVRAVEGFGSMWVADYGGDTVARVDLRTNRVAARVPMSVAFQPDGIAVAAGSVWVGSASDGSVARIDPDTNRVVSESIQTGTDASEITFAFGSLWVSAIQDGDLYRLDPADGKVVATIHTGGQPLFAGPVGDQLWVGLFEDGDVVRIDPSTNRIAGRTPLDNGVQGIAVLDGAAWVAVESDETGRLYRLDIDAGQPVAMTEVGVQPKLVVAIAGSLWFPLFGPGQLARFQPAVG